MIGRQQYSGRKLEGSERGGVLVLVALFIFVLFGFTALSIDVANVYREKHKAHDATDAAALAGVLKLGDPTVSVVQQASDAIAEAEFLANTNGVKHGEITSSNTGTIQVGSWDGANFTANTPTYNAVRVPAQRTVTNNFGRVVGFPFMTATVDSIATIGVISVPYGVPACYVGTVGSTNLLQNWGNVACSSSSGNWGMIDLCGVLNPGDVIPAITGGGCFGSVGETTTTRTGVPNKTADGFTALYNSGQRIVVLPITSDFPTGGSGNVTIQNFVIVQLLNGGTGTGNGWNISVQILGIGFDDLRRLGLGPVRSLVE